MTQEDVIRMAEEADLGFLLGDNWMLHHELQAFAKLVAAHEREACAKECEQMDSTTDYYGIRVELVCAEVIRARGEQA